MSIKGLGQKISNRTKQAPRTILLTEEEAAYRLAGTKQPATVSNKITLRTAPEQL